MVNFGKGPTLREAFDWLQDDSVRRREILDVAERNSVIEGLAPFTEETRRRLLAQLEHPNLPPPAPRESPQPSADSPS